MAWHEDSTAPRRVLALDGGGIRGILSLAFLERLETVVQCRNLGGGYFDLVGGTSTGAIIAAGLALGNSASHLIELYLHLSKKGFRRQPRWMIGGALAPKFHARALHKALEEQFGSETLGSANLRCGLGIVAKRLDTGSVWLFHNHPRGPYFAQNREMRLADLLRASTAAPSYFAPERLAVAPGVEGVFVDGGVSPHNNPALLLTMLASLDGYGFRWPMGAERLQVTSIGTGSPRTKPMWGTYETMPAALLAIDSLRSMMQDSSALVQTVMQWMGSCAAPWPIDGEIGDLCKDQLAGGPHLRYERYDAPLTDEWLNGRLGLGLSAEELETLKQFDQPDLAPRLLEIGRKCAEVLVR